LVPTSDGGNDFVGISGPHEGFGVIVGLSEKAVDGGLQIDDRSEDAAFEVASGQLGEEALDGIEPGGRGRDEMEDEARMPTEPGANLAMLVGSVIVEDDVDNLAGRDFGFDGVRWTPFVRQPDPLLKV
jgi:hypothetical protein